MFAQLPPKCGMDAAQHRAAGGIGYGKKTIISDYGECELAVPRDRNGEFEPKVIEKRQTRTDEIEQKIMQIRTLAEQSSARNVAARYRRYAKADLRN